jgi:hypothetical protein
MIFHWRELGSRVHGSKDADGKCRNADKDCHRPEPERKRERSAVRAIEPAEQPFDRPEHDRRVLSADQQSRAEHRRERQRNQCGRKDSDGDRHAELEKEPPDQPAGERDGQKNSAERK